MSISNVNSDLGGKVFSKKFLFSSVLGFRSGNNAVQIVVVKIQEIFHHPLSPKVIAAFHSKQILQLFFFLEKRSSKMSNCIISFALLLFTSSLYNGICAVDGIKLGSGHNHVDNSSTIDPVDVSEVDSLSSSTIDPTNITDTAIVQKTVRSQSAPPALSRGQKADTAQPALNRGPAQPVVQKTETPQQPDTLAPPAQQIRRVPVANFKRQVLRRLKELQLSKNQLEEAGLIFDKRCDEIDEIYHTDHDTEKNIQPKYDTRNVKMVSHYHENLIPAADELFLDRTTNTLYTASKFVISSNTIFFSSHSDSFFFIFWSPF